MATAKLHSLSRHAAIIIAVATLHLLFASNQNAVAAATTGADVICDLSNASNVSTTSCTNTGSSGTNITLNGSPTRTSRGQGSIGFNLLPSAKINMALARWDPLPEWRQSR